MPHRVRRGEEGRLTLPGGSEAPAGEELVVFGGLADRHPQIDHRALGQAAGVPSPSTWFMAGLFSTLDILFNAPIETLLEGLPLSPGVVDAIARRSGVLGASIDAIIAFERGEWSGARCGRLTPGDFTAACLSALEWTHQWETTFGPLAAQAR